MLRLDTRNSNAPAVRVASPPVLLVVGISENSRALMRRMAEVLRSAMFEVAGCAEAIAVLRLENVQVVVCEQSLPDGDWKVLLESIDKLIHRPNVVVASQLADHRLWAEVLNLGAYDLLPLPFEATEASRVVRLAWESSRRHCEPATGRQCGGGPVCATLGAIAK